MKHHGAPQKTPKGEKGRARRLGPHGAEPIPKLSEADQHRFWSHVDRIWDDETFCWEWQGSVTGPNGYGQFTIGGRPWGAHRIAYVLEHGPIPPGAVICHSCDNPRCCRPEHLFAGAQHDNNDDKVAKGRVDAREGRRVDPDEYFEQ